MKGLFGLGRQDALLAAVVVGVALEALAQAGAVVAEAALAALVLLGGAVKVVQQLAVDQGGPPGRCRRPQRRGRTPAWRPRSSPPSGRSRRGSPPRWSGR